MDSPESNQQYGNHLQPHLAGEKGAQHVPQNNGLLLYASADAHSAGGVRWSFHLHEYDGEEPRRLYPAGSRRQVYGAPHPLRADLVHVYSTVRLYAEYKGQAETRTHIRYSGRYGTPGIPIPLHQQPVVVSRYNAIYGSFAALPMFLLWLQVSWTICLFGAELTYAGQNIRNFSFDKDARNISRRYRDFISILIMSLIAKRFEQDVQPYTAEEISEECQIPIRLTHETLYELQEINLLHEVVTDEKSEDIAYQPSMDINKMNVALLLDKLDTHGSEDFKIDKENEFNNQWGALLKAREEYYKNASKVLLKDL